MTATRTADQTGLPVWQIAGMPHRVRVRAADLPAGLTLMEVDVPPGRGVPPHTHANEDEAFHVLSGTVTFSFDRRAEPLVLTAGDYLAAPRGHEHGFRNAGTAPAAMLIAISPGAGAEEMFAELDALLASMPGADPQAIG